MTATIAVAAMAAVAMTTQPLLSGCLLLKHSRLPASVQEKQPRLIDDTSLRARTVFVPCPRYL